MTKLVAPFLSFIPILLLYGCSDRPSEKDISKKVLLEYACPEAAKVNNLKILRTEETESTGKPPVFKFNVSGEVEWVSECAEMPPGKPQGTKEKFEKLVTLSKTEDGTWQ